MALSREHHGKNVDGRKARQATKSEKWHSKDKRRKNRIYISILFPDSTRLIVFCSSNSGSYNNSPFVLKKNDVPHGADGNFFKLKKIKEKPCSSALITSCRLLCRFNQMAGSILQVLLYINERQSVIFDSGKWNVHHLEWSANWHYAFCTTLGPHGIFHLKCYGRGFFCLLLFSIIVRVLVKKISGGSKLSKLCPQLISSRRSRQ